MTGMGCVFISEEQLAISVGISRARLARLHRLGLLEPDPFTVTTASRLRRMLRLHRDLGVNLIGCAIILELLEQIEQLQAAPAALDEGRNSWIPTA
jgi:hypothetical protein